MTDLEIKDFLQRYERGFLAGWTQAMEENPSFLTVQHNPGKTPCEIETLAQQARDITENADSDAEVII